MILRCLLEGIFLGIFSFLVMLAAWAGGACSHRIKLLRERHGDAVAS
ncbi:MAG: hypothetical protein LBI81_01645 [Puniceicoccales bacterium]|nr:hypothetical protein [Puniceicoccales bacterium]